MACYFPKFHYFLCIILKPKPTQLCRSASSIKRWTAGGLFCCALCLFKTVTQLNVECFLTLWFLPDLLSSAVRSKVVKGQRTYRLFAGALPWTEKIFLLTVDSLYIRVSQQVGCGAVWLGLQHFPALEMDFIITWLAIVWIVWKSVTLHSKVFLLRNVNCKPVRSTTG